MLLVESVELSPLKLRQPAYTHIHTYIYIYMHINICVYMSIYICTWICPICRYKHIHVHVFVESLGSSGEPWQGHGGALCVGLA